MALPVRMSGEVCLPGLQGFPVQVTGWSGYTNRSEIVMPNDIELQFSPAEVPVYYNNNIGYLYFNGQNSFYLGGTQYYVQAVRFARPKQEGIADRSNAPFAELSIWGVPNQNNQPKADLGVLVLPVFQQAAEDKAGEALYGVLTREPVKFSKIIPIGQGANVVRYTTCCETDDRKSRKIDVAYWTKGVAMNQEMAKKFPNEQISPWGVPNIIGVRFLTIYQETTAGKESREYNDIRGNLRPYQVAPLGVTSPEFKNGFRLVLNFEPKAKSSMELNAYKCIPINRQRDIKHGKLLLDPATGRRFDEEVAQAESEETVDQGEGGNMGKLWMWIAVALGVLLGLSGLAAILVVISQFLFTRKAADLPPISPAALSHAASVGAPATQISLNVNTT